MGGGVGAVWECKLQHRSCPLNSKGPELFSRIFQFLGMDHSIPGITFQASPEKVAPISPGQSSGEAWSCAAALQRRCGQATNSICLDLQRHFLQWACIAVIAYTKPSKSKQGPQGFLFVCLLLGFSLQMVSLDVRGTSNLKVYSCLPLGIIS